MDRQQDLTDHDPGKDLPDGMIPGSALPEFPQCFADAIPVALAAKDRQGRFRGVNRAMEALSRMPPERFLGHSSADIMPEEVARHHADVDREVMETGRTVTFKQNVPDLDGEVRQIEYRKAPWRDAAGTIRGTVTALIEEPEVTRLKGTLAEQNHLLGERLKELRCLYDVSGILLRHRSDPAAAAREVAARLPAAFQFPQLATARIELRDGIVGQAGPFRDRACTLSAPVYLDGAEIGCIRVGYLSPYAGLDDVPFVVEEQELLDEVARRLSRHLQNFDDRQRVADSEARFRATFEQAAVGICEIGIDGRITRANDRFQEMIGYSHPELANLRLPDITEDVDAQDYFTLNDALSGNIVPRYTVEKRLQRKDGTIMWARLTMSVARRTDGLLAEFICVIEDVSAQHDATERLTVLSERMARSLRGTIDVLSRLQELQDPYTSGHQRRVTELAVETGRRMGLDEEQLLHLEMGAMIHDVGKLAIPTQLLTKPGKLTDAEFDLIRTHAVSGWKTVDQSELPREVAEVVRHHHERLDGSGYPDGLTGDAIPLLARITAVADTVEAITSHRPYRAARGLETAVRVITEGRGRLFDPQAVDICLAVLEEGVIAWTAGVPKL